MKKYSVVVPTLAKNLSINHPTLYTFLAKNNKAAREAFKQEKAKLFTIFHKECRLVSGKVCWKNAIVIHTVTSIFVLR